jgi:hypothetical protein
MKDQCFIQGCDGPVEAACAYSSSSKRDVVLVWLCKNHGSVFHLSPGESRTDILVQEVSRTCRGPFGQDGRHCGAYATHLIVFGTEFEDERQAEIRITSVCERHAEPFIREAWLEVPPE